MSEDTSIIPKAIGPYKVDRKIATGGMGEIYLVQDTCCDRKMAIKKIRSDRLQYPTLKDRFLREAKIAAQMTHPCIIPIYNLHLDTEEIYYTMPYIEGETLKKMLRDSFEEEKRGVHRFSMSYLIRIFLNVCQAIAYCHSRGILHRDVKPENVIVGKYGETFILDWGLADFVNYPTQDEYESWPCMDKKDLTRPGKIPGTLAYIPPERAFGKPASFASDIYALGVILYQILTLKLPFQRTSHKKIKKQLEREEFIDPLDRAPYRDIPLELARIAKKCLEKDPLDRYHKVEDLIQEIENFIAGKGQWIESAPLSIQQKKDWQFQENILIARQIALTQSKSDMEWVNLMLSKRRFSDHFKIETHVTLGACGKGIGFLLNLSENLHSKRLLEDSLCLWIGSQQEPGCSLLRSNISILSTQDVCLLANTKYHIRIERVDSHMRLFIDNKLCLDFLSQIPMTGPYFGVVLKDDDLSLDPIQIFISSPSIMINCLKIADTFLAHKLYDKALAEYKKISYSFSGRTEGREATFRAGITLIEAALSQKQDSKRHPLFQQALEEFSKLRATPGAPLEYLGKSIVYKACNEIKEEIKCLDICLRKYAHHPLIPLVEEEMIFRLHESACQCKAAAYYFTLLVLHHKSSIFSEGTHKSLLISLKSQMPALPFLEALLNPSEQEEYAHLSIQLAYWLNKPSSLVEILSTFSSKIIQANALFCLIELGHVDLAKEHLFTLANAPEKLTPLQILLDCKVHTLTLPATISKLKPLDCFDNARALAHSLEYLLFTEPKKVPLSPISTLAAQHQLLEKPWMIALIIHERFDELNAFLDEACIASMEWKQFFTGCVIAKSRGLEAATQYYFDQPFHTVFTGYYLETERQLKEKNFKKLLDCEKKELLKQIYLFNLSIGERKKTATFSQKLKKEFKHAAF